MMLKLNISLTIIFSTIICIHTDSTELFPADYANLMNCNYEFFPHTTNIDWPITLADGVGVYVWVNSVTKIVTYFGETRSVYGRWRQEKKEGWGDIFVPFLTNSEAIAIKLETYSLGIFCSPPYNKRPKPLILCNPITTDICLWFFQKFNGKILG